MQHLLQHKQGFWCGDLLLRASTNATQGGVFLLQRADDTVDPDQVLKVVFRFSLGGLFGMTDLEREWKVGRHLALLTQSGKGFSGFMSTGAGVVTKSGQFKGMMHRIVCCNRCLTVRNCQAAYSN